MPRFTIMYIYEIRAKNLYEATDELMIARQNHFEKVFLKKVLVKDTEPKLPRDKVNVFAQKHPKQVAKMVTIFRRQLFGK